jgi:YcaO-like protein with predicted kinase domain
MTAATSIEEYASVLSSFGQVVEFDISALDRLGIPVTSCSLAVDGRLQHNGNGYGLTDEAARLSGLGELAEGVLSAAHLTRLREQSVRGSRHELVRSRGSASVVDPRTLCLPAGSAYTESTPLEWLPLERVRSGETVWVPLEFVASETGELGGAEPLIQPITNGLGAGLDATRPLTHGIGEILQRHTNGLRFRALDRRSPVIDPAGLPASVADLVARLEQSGVRPVLKHAATELGVCSTYVMGVDESPSAGIMVTACGEAAHPSAEVSLTKALLEYANSRSRKAFCFGDRDAAFGLAPPEYRAGLPTDPQGEPRAVAAMRAWAELAPAELRSVTAPRETSRVGYADITAGVGELSSQTALLEHLLDRLEGHDVLSTTTRVGDVVVAKTMVTGLEVEILSYGRLGELGVAQLIEADLGLVRIQDGPSDEHHDRVCLTPEAEERLGGPAWYSYAAAAHLVGPLYPLYREPPRHSVAV